MQLLICHFICKLYLIHPAILHRGTSLSCLLISLCSYVSFLFMLWNKLVIVGKISVQDYENILRHILRQHKTVYVIASTRTNLQYVVCFKMTQKYICTCRYIYYKTNICTKSLRSVVCRWLFLVLPNLWNLVQTFFGIKSSWDKSQFLKKCWNKYGEFWYQEINIVHNGECPI